MRKENPMMCLIMMVTFVIGTFGLAKADFTFGDRVHKSARRLWRRGHLDLPARVA
jgi:hypothetical protein